MPPKTPFWSPEEGDDPPLPGFAAPVHASASTPPSPGSTSSSSIDAREMIGQVHALRGKVGTSQDKVARLRELNEELVAENERLAAEIEELVAQRNRLERRPKRDRDRDRGAGLPPSAGKGLDDDVEFVELDEDVDMTADGQVRARGLLAYLALMVKRARQRLRLLETRLVRRLPIVKSVAKLSTRYGASMGVYFSFCSWLMLNASVQLLIYSPLLLKHGYDVLTGAVTPTRFESGLALRSSNWWAFYSSWPQADGALYTAACSVSLLVTILTSARKFAAERRAAQYVEVYGLGANRMRFARAIFNGWDLQVDSGSALSEAQAGIADRLRLLVDEHERSARIEARSARERNVLWARRLLGIIVSVAYTACAWAGIIALQLNALRLSAYLDAQADGLSLLAAIGVPLVVSAVNIILPMLAMAVTNFEQWDYPATTLRLQVFRLYSGKILNLLINVAGYGILLGTQNSTPRAALPLFGLTVQLVEPNDSTFGCAENQIGTMLLLFVGVEFVVDKLAAASRAYAFRHLLPLLTGRPWVREPFPTAQKVINLIYFQALLWLCAPYFPFVTVLGPLLLYATFKFDQWLLQSMMAKPADPWAADDVGAFFFRIFFTTFGVALAWYYLFLRVPGVHACGPHAAVETPWAAMEAYIQTVGGLSSAYAVLLNALVLWVVLALLWVRGSTSESHKELLQEFADVRITQLSQQAELLEAKVRMQERQLAALKRQRAKDK